MHLMINACIATLAIFVLLVLSEFLWRKAHIRGEFARKFVHIIAGSFIAFLPFWVSYGWLSLLAIGFILANVLNRYTQLFHAIHAITRKSWGDLLFGIGILICSLIRPNRWLFAGAILQVALADGMAAVVGSHYSKRRYRMFDHYKSPIGTLTFCLCSLLISILALMVGNLGGHNVIEVLIAVPLLMTLFENVSGYGTDNIFLPLGYLLVMQALRI